MQAHEVRFQLLILNAVTARGLIDNELHQKLFQLDLHILWLVFEELIEGSPCVDGAGVGPQEVRRYRLRFSGSVPEGPRELFHYRVHCQALPEVFQEEVKPCSEKARTARSAGRQHREEIEAPRLA